MDNTSDMLAGSSLFPTLDLKRGYWHVELDLIDRGKTALTLESGLWPFTVMYFDLYNAPATFKKVYGESVENTLMEDLFGASGQHNCYGNNFRLAYEKPERSVPTNSGN